MVYFKSHNVLLGFQFLSYTLYSLQVGHFCYYSLEFGGAVESKQKDFS